MKTFWDNYSEWSPIKYFFHVLDGVIVSFILGDGAGRKVEHPPERVSDPVGDGLVAGGSVPDGNDVLLEANGDDGAANLLADHELLAQHCHDEVLPAPGGEALTQSHDPLAAVAISLVLWNIEIHMLLKDY